MRLFFISSIVAGCGGSGDDATLLWYTTCGDPVCNVYTGPFDGVAACTTEADGVGCDVEGTSCDPVSDCNALLVCAAEDPKDQEGGCPISKAEVKRDITYLDPMALQARAQEALQMRLATWQYTWDEADTPPHLGFLIDDVGESPAVRSDGTRVDLYGYTSLALAAIQVQQQQIALLEAKIAAIEAGACGSSSEGSGSVDDQR